MEMQSVNVTDPAPHSAGRGKRERRTAAGDPSRTPRLGVWYPPHSRSLRTGLHPQTIEAIWLSLTVRGDLVGVHGKQSSTYRLKQAERESEPGGLDHRSWGCSKGGSSWAGTGGGQRRGELTGRAAGAAAPSPEISGS